MFVIYNWWWPWPNIDDTNIAKQHMSQRNEIEWNILRDMWPQRTSNQMLTGRNNWKILSRTTSHLNLFILVAGLLTIHSDGVLLLTLKIKYIYYSLHIFGIPTHKYGCSCMCSFSLSPCEVASTNKIGRNQAKWFSMNIHNMWQWNVTKKNNNAGFRSSLSIQAICIWWPGIARHNTVTRHSRRWNLKASIDCTEVIRAIEKLKKGHQQGPYIHNTAKQSSTHKNWIIVTQKLKPKPNTKALKRNTNDNNEVQDRDGERLSREWNSYKAKSATEYGIKH